MAGLGRTRQNTNFGDDLSCLWVALQTRYGHKSHLQDIPDEYHDDMNGLTSPLP